MKLIPGLTSGELIGIGFTPSTIDAQNGERQSSESSFLRDAIQNSRAPQVYKNTLVSKIIFDANNTATGVECFMAGTFGTPPLTFNILGRKQIVLFSGAFQSPQLLMVSGIGNSTELQRLGIETLVDLPGVGQNLWDHVMFGTIHAVNLQTDSAAMNNQTLAAQAAEGYDETGAGPLSSFSASPYGWEKLPESYRGNLTKATVSALDDPNVVTPDWPELEWLPVGAYGGCGTGPKSPNPMDGLDYAMFRTGLSAPLSRGIVKLASDSMLDHPLVDPAWLSHPADKELAIAAFKRQREVWDFLIRSGIAHPSEALPGFSTATDDQIWTFIQESISTIWHASATCKMGRDNDSTAVVDSRARVFGVQNLRVVECERLSVLATGASFSSHLRSS